MREKSQSDALFASEIDMTMGTEWPTRAFILLSSHGKVAAERKFETMDEIEDWDDVEHWIDEQARKHWPDSDYARTFPVVAAKA